MTMKRAVTGAAAVLVVIVLFAADLTGQTAEYGRYELMEVACHEGSRDELTEVGLKLFPYFGVTVP